MENRDILNYCINSLENSEVDKSQCFLKEEKKYELNVAHGNINLLRTNFNSNLNITVIKDNKKGSISINKLQHEYIDKALNDVIDLCSNGEQDEAYDIAYLQENEEFSCGDEKPNLDKMYDLLNQFTIKVKNEFPEIILEETFFEFIDETKYLMNSNGVDLKSRKGLYQIMLDFSSKRGDKSSSFNYSIVSLKNLEDEILNWGNIRRLLKESIEHIEAQPLQGKFNGKLILTPQCLYDFISSYVNTYLSDMALISGTSKLKDKLEKIIASEKLTLSSEPISKEISNGYFITSDGYKAENLKIIDKGVLKSFVLTQYGANKTKKERSKNHGEIYVIEPGNKTLDDIIKEIDEGVLMCRFSGGRPNSNGDFSGVAKNSFYVENGEVKYPINETMISGNLYEIFNNILYISKERINLGYCNLPWISFDKIIISGK